MFYFLLLQSLKKKKKIDQKNNPHFENRFGMHQNL